MCLSESATNKYLSIHGRGGSYLKIGNNVITSDNTDRLLSLSAAPYFTTSEVCALEVNSGAWRNLYASAYTGTVTCKVQKHFKDAETLKRYMAVLDDSGYTFNHFYVGVTHLNLRPGSDGVGYKATVAGNDAVLSEIAGYGYKLWLTEDRVLTASKDGAPTENMTTVTARVQNFDVEGYGEASVNGCVFITLNDGTVIESTAVTFTLRSILEAVSANAEDYDQTQLSSVRAMIARFSDAMAAWSIDSLR